MTPYKSFPCGLCGQTVRPQDKLVCQSCVCVHCQFCQEAQGFCEHWLTCSNDVTMVFESWSQFWVPALPEDGDYPDVVPEFPLREHFGSLYPLLAVYDRLDEAPPPECFLDALLEFVRTPTISVPWEMSGTIPGSGGVGSHYFGLDPAASRSEIAALFAQLERCFDTLAQFYQAQGTL